MVSPSRERDRKIRLMILEAMKIAISTGNYDIAKSLGESSAKMAERIKTNNYQKEDAFINKIENIWKNSQIKHNSPNKTS